MTSTCSSALWAAGDSPAVTAAPPESPSVPVPVPVAATVSGWAACIALRIFVRGVLDSGAAALDRSPKARTAGDALLSCSVHPAA